MPLLESDAPEDPLDLFSRWYADAQKAGVPQPDAVALATASITGEPSARMVLFKGIEDGAFVFYSDHGSRKGKELATNPRAAVVFYWSATRHQVRVSGRVRKLSRAASAAYFHSRPRGAQLSALASRQSEPLGSRSELDDRLTKVKGDLGAEPVPRPPTWGGFRLVPTAWEFWQHRASRLHDRFRCELEPSGGWRIERLFP